MHRVALSGQLDKKIQIRITKGDLMRYNEGEAQRWLAPSPVFEIMIVLI